MRAVAGDESAAPSTLHLATTVVDGLVSMQGQRFDELLTLAREPLLEWWRTGEPDDLERLVATLDTRMSREASSGEAKSAMAQPLAKVVAGGVGLTVGAAGAGPIWAVVAALVSDGVLAAREKLGDAKNRAFRTRVIEYGLGRTRKSSAVQ
jgi:hypothetical protein